MTIAEALFALPYLVSLTLALVIAFYMVQRPGVTGSGPIAAYALCQAVWIGGFLIESFATTLEQKILWDDIQFLPFFAIGLVMGLLGKSLVGKRPLPLVGTDLLLLGIVVVEVVVVFTDPLHHWVRPDPVLREAFPRGELSYPFTPVMYAMAAVFYVVVGLALYELHKATRAASGTLKKQANWVIAGLAIPVVAGLAPLLGVTVGPHRDLTPLTCGLGDLVMMWGIFHYRIFDLLPVAYETVFRAFDDPLAVVDKHGVITAHNPAFALLANRDPNLVGEKYLAVLPDGAKNTLHYDLKTSVVRNDSGKREGEVHHFRDVTQARLAALGRMADNVAHELNSPLASVLSATRQLQEWTEDDRFGGPEGSPENRILRLARFPDIRKGAERHQATKDWAVLLGKQNIPDAGSWAEKLTDVNLVPSQADEVLPLLRQADASEAFLLAIRRFSVRTSLWIIRESAERSHQILSVLKKQDIAPTSDPPVVTSLSSCLTSAATVEAPRHTKTCRVVQEFGVGLAVLGHETRLQQLFQQLVRNALQAMANGGTLVLRTRKEGALVVAEVEDNGPGIPSAQQTQIFESYFSTRRTGNGSGFGLEYVKLIAREHGATVDFESRPGRTVFRVSFPVLTPDVLH